MVKFYYGLSGTFKTTTILSEKKLANDTLVVWSMIKRWKDLEIGLFNEMTKITEIEERCFAWCDSLTKIKLPIVVLETALASFMLTGNITLAKTAMTAASRVDTI